MVNKKIKKMIKIFDNNGDKLKELILRHASRNSEIKSSPCSNY